MKKLLVLLILLAFITPTLSCGGRIPSAKSAHSLTKSYFKSYGKKYRASVLGQNPVEKVEINRVFEQSLNWAQIEAFLNLQNGQMARVLVTTKKTPPFGWSVFSWEMLDLR